MGEAMGPDMSVATAGTLYAVGVGPGDPELVTLKAARVLEACSVIAAVRSEGGRSRRGPGGTIGNGERTGAATALDIAREVVDLADKRIIELTFAMSHDPEVLRASHTAAAETVCAELAAGRDVAMPVLGDPSIYATFHHIKPLVEAAGFRMQVIPGVPSFCAVAATLGANLTPTMGTPLHVLPTGYVDVRRALGLPGTKVFMKAGAPLDELRDALCEEGLLERAGLVQDCGLPTQMVVRSLAELENAGGTGIVGADEVGIGIAGADEGETGLEGEAGAGDAAEGADEDETRTSQPQLGGYFTTVVVG